MIKLNKDSIIFYLLLLIFIISVVFIINIFSFFSPSGLCYISLEKDVLSGNKKTMHKAISLLKKEDKEAFKNLCKYVDTISEKYCHAYDKRVESREEKDWQPGCYVRGSKTIYIKPVRGDSVEIIRNRAEEIKKFMMMSKNFWDNYKK